MKPPATPFLVLDAAAVTRNLQRLSAYAAQHGIGVRPHTKTHKSRRLAKMQLDAGAVGLTAAKVGEAEVMAEVGSDILLAYPAVDAPRCARLGPLARKVTLRVALDSTQAATALAAAASEAGSTIGVLVDLDVGLGRTGVPSPEAARELARQVARTSGLRLDGLFCYPGQVWNAPREQAAALRAVDARLAETLDLWKRDGLEARIVSGGSTPTAYQSHLVTRLTEIRPGTYIFNDMNTVRGGFCALSDCAARIVCTVVSDAVPGQVVVDAGSKTLGADRCHPAPQSGHGHVLEYPEARISALSEEHGQVDMTREKRRPRIGERLTLIPNHICPCINLRDQVWWKEEDGALSAWPVDARGMVS